MNEIASSTAAAATTGTSSSSNTAISSNSIGEEFNTFLQLLTAQVQNQDPLSPLDSTQFVEQLATFSSLEQQVQTNQSLEGIATMIGDLHTILANEWLGQEVAVTSQHVAYEGQPVEFEIDPSLAHDQAVLTVIDSNGEAVWQEELDATATRYSWNGEQSGASEAAPIGVYQFQIDLFQNGQPIARTDAQIVSKVTTLGSENGKLVLGTDNYLTADLSSTRKTGTE